MMGRFNRDQGRSARRLEAKCRPTQPIIGSRGVSTAAQTLRLIGFKKSAALAILAALTRTRGVTDFE
jgi:hypothetical protein